MADFADFSEQMTRGDTHKFRFQVQLNGINQDTTTWLKFWFTAKNSIDDLDSAAVMQLTSDLNGGITAVDATIGLYEVEIPIAATSDLANVKTKLFCDIQGKDGSGKIWTLAKGHLTVLPESTRSTT